MHIRNVKKYKFVVLLFVQLLAQAHGCLRCKGDGCSQSAAVRAELLFCRRRGCAAAPGAARAPPAERAACRGRGWSRDPGSAPAPAAKESCQRHPALLPEPCGQGLLGSVSTLQCNSPEVVNTSSLLRCAPLVDAVRQNLTKKPTVP